MTESKIEEGEEREQEMGGEKRERNENERKEREICADGE